MTLLTHLLLPLLGLCALLGAGQAALGLYLGAHARKAEGRT